MRDQIALFPEPPRDPEAEALEILAAAIDQYNPSHVFAMFSGGHDSLCATHIASRHPRFSGAVHVNTGIGIPETRDFVRKNCRKHGWPLKEYSPPVSYDDLVLKWGFPGPHGHTLMYNRLKERCIAALVREHKTHRRDKIALVTGVRKQESRRRMGHITAVDVEGVRLWVAPIVDWLAEDKLDYIAAHGLERNPVVDLLCMSGECLCGAFAKPNEIREIETWFPETAARIRALEGRAKAAGVHCKWGTRPPEKPDPRQGHMGLCWSCEAKLEAINDTVR